DMTRPKSPPSIQPADDAQTHGARPGGVERNADTHEPFDQPQPRPAWQVAHEVYQWLGLLRFIEGDRTAAAEFFRIARPLTPPRTGVQSARERMLVRVYFISRTGRAFPPHAAPTEGGDLGALLILGDLFLEVSDIESAGTLFEHVLQSQGPEQSQSLVSYAHLRRGRCLSRSRDATERAKAGGDFLTAHRLAPEAAWAAEALFLAGNAHWNYERDLNKSLELWRQVLEEYADSSVAERSAYFIGVAYESSERYAEAEAAFEDLKERYPDSGFVKLADEHLKKVRREIRRR
ncbi:MAG: tetratricopeptide repeat protein, partial [Planctomycetaceae bacterium]